MSKQHRSSNSCGKPRKLAICATAVLALLLQASQLPTLAASKEVGITDTKIVIGSCGALTGPAAGLGKEEIVGAQAYIRYINDQGGVGGRKIDLKTFDDGYDATKCKTAFDKFLADQCFAGLGFVGSMTSKEYIPMIEKSKVPVIGFMTGAEFLQTPFHKYAFCVRAPYLVEMGDQIDRIWADLGAKRVAVIHQSQEGGSPIQRATEQALAKHNAKPISVAFFPHNTLDVSAAISKTQAGSPDVVVLTGPYLPLSEIVKRAHKANWHPIFMTSSMVGTEEFVAAAGKDAEGTLISQVVPPYSRQDLSGIALYKRLLQKYYPAEKPNFISLEGFVDAMVLVEGLKGAGKELTREKFMTTLESIHDKDIGLGPHLKLSYGKDQHQGFQSVFTTVIRDGRAVPIFNYKVIQRQ